MSLAQALEGVTGPFIVGTAVSTFLFGVTLTQCYTYFSNFKTDRIAYRLALVILLLVDVSHTIFCQVTLWLWFVGNYGEESSVALSPWSFAVDPIMCGIAAFVVQMFYAHRIFLLGQESLVVPCLVVYGSLFQLAWSVGATIKIFEIRRFVDFHRWTYGVACWLGGAAVTDLLITASLVWLLSRSKGSLRHTNNTIDRLISLTIETNGLTFTVALVDLILFVCLSNGAHVAPNLCLIKLYFNSFLVSLNSRASLSEGLGGTRSLRSNAFKSDGNIRCSHVEEINGTPDSRSTRSGELQRTSKKRDGIHVFTTATLSASHISDQVDRISFPDTSLLNGIGPLRADTVNGFTTKIVGGIQSEKNKLKLNEKRLNLMA